MMMAHLCLDVGQNLNLQLPLQSYLENDNESDTNNVIDLGEHNEHKENNEGNENENTGVGGVKLNPKQENVVGMYRRVY